MAIILQQFMMFIDKKIVKAAIRYKRICSFFTNFSLIQGGI